MTPTRRINNNNNNNNNNKMDVPIVNSTQSQSYVHLRDTFTTVLHVDNRLAN